MVRTFPSAFGVDIRLLIAALVIVLLIVFGVRSCASSALEGSSGDVVGGVSGVLQGDSPDETPQEAAEGEEWDAGVAVLYSLLESEYADTLVEAAQTDDDVAWIIKHAADYAVDGSYVQYKLLRLAAKEPEARFFVRAWPERYPSEEGEACDSVSAGSLPLLYQWDVRWGYTLYCNTTFALTGCCPTALAMVYQGITGKSDMTPYDMGRLADSRGYMDEFNGTSDAFLTDCAYELGLSCSRIDVSNGSLVGALRSGAVLICNVGPGDFTTGGHYIVLHGLDGSGRVLVNDPFSAKNSAKPWDVDTIIGQTKALFSYTAA